MPDVLVEVRGDWLKRRSEEFLEAIEDGIAAALRTPKDDKILRLVVHPPENFSIPRGASEKFTHIEITMFAGRSLDVKRALYGAIVRNLEPFGVPPDDVKVILLEVQRADVGMRGGRAACDIAIGYDIDI